MVPTTYTCVNAAFRIQQLHFLCLIITEISDDNMSEFYYLNAYV